MNFKKLFLARRRLVRVAGKLEYYFFTSILVSAFFVSAVLTIGFDAFFKSEPIQSAYVELFSKSVSSAADLNLGTLPEFAQRLAKLIGNALAVVFENAPSTLAFFLISAFLLCPVYQGSVRYCAYLIEEEKPLPLAAVLFYFTSPKLYFSSVWLNVKIAAKKWAMLLLFLLPSGVFFAFGSVFDSTYFKQQELGGAVKLLSLVLLILSLLLCAIYLNKYAAVRYLFALGHRKKLFKTSAKLTKNRHAWLFFMRLALLLNLVPALLVIPAPACLSRALSGEGLIIKWLIKEGRGKTAKRA